MHCIIHIYTSTTYAKLLFMTTILQTTAKKRLTREESQALTRERLIDAAHTLFIVNGYGAASIRDIADKAGFSQGAFYSNFSSKEDILLILLRRHMQAEAMQLSGLMDNDERTPECVLEDIAAWAATLNQDTDWCMLSIELQLHANRSPAFAILYQQMWDEHRAVISHIIEQLFNKLGRLPPADPTELAASFMALAHGLALQRVSTQSALSGRMIMVFLRGLIASAKQM